MYKRIDVQTYRYTLIQRYVLLPLDNTVGT